MQVVGFDGLAKALFGLEQEMKNHLAAETVFAMATRAKEIGEATAPSRSGASLKIKRKYKPMKKSFSIRKGTAESPWQLVNKAAAIHVIDKGRIEGQRTIKPRRPKAAKGTRRPARKDQAQWKTIKVTMGSTQAPAGITKPMQAQLESEGDAILQGAIQRTEAKF